MMLIIEYTTPSFASTVKMCLIVFGSCSFDMRIFSDANTIPSLHRTPITVLKQMMSANGRHQKNFAYPLFSTALFAYSTWKIRPAGEKVVAERSYWIKWAIINASSCLTPAPIELILFLIESKCNSHNQKTIHPDRIYKIASPRNVLGSIRWRFHRFSSVKNLYRCRQSSYPFFEQARLEK